MIEVYFDGAAWLWKKAGYGLVIKRGSTWLFSDFGAVPCEPQRSTCNVAEHYALYKALSWLLANGYKDEEIVVRGDSKLVISQLFRGWKCRDPRLPYFPYMVANKELAAQFSNLKGKLIPRTMNTQADDLSKQGIRSKVIDLPITTNTGLF
jgi:ribonuclease HI